jgi:hypothetical protein
MKRGGGPIRRGLTCLIVLTTFGCGSPDEETGDTTEDEQSVAPGAVQYGEDAMAVAEAIIESRLAAEKARSAARYPCSLFSAEDIEELLGAPVEDGDYTTVNRHENIGDWQSDDCLWSSTIDRGPELDLWVSRAGQFPSGKIECYGLEPGDRAFPDLADRSSWKYQKSWGWGTLRACTDSALLEVELMYGADEDSVLRMTRAVAARVFGATQAEP